MPKPIPYDEYNREERALCAHLFRLLHEGLAESPANSGLAQVMARIKPRGKPELPDPTKLRFDRVGIYAEVALIRDVYANRKARWEKGDREEWHIVKPLPATLPAVLPVAD